VTATTKYVLHLFDGHGRGRQAPAPQTIDPKAGQLLKFAGPPSPALELNAVVVGRTSGACGRITKVLDAATCVIETIPRTFAGLAFAQNSSGTPGVGEICDFDNCQGTAGGYLVNHAGTYAIGTTSIAVDTGVGTMLVGDRLKFAGHATVYTVATALTAGTVVITPSLTATVADNEAVTLRGGEAVLLPLGDSQQLPLGNQYVAEHHDAELSARIEDGLGNWCWWDRQAKVCELIAVISATGTFRKGDACTTSSGGAFTVQVVIDNGGGNLGLYVLRKRGTPTAGDTVTNRTTTGSGTIALMGANTPLYQPTGGFVPYSPFPNAGGTETDDQYWERIPQGNGGLGENSLGPDAKLMHLLDAYFKKATDPNDRHFRMVPFCSWDDEGVTDGNLGGVTLQVVKCSGTFPASGTLVVGQTVTGPNGWSATVHGWNNGLKYLFVRATNGAVLGAGTLTLSGGATVTGTGAAFGWAKGSTHWNNMVAQITAATTAFGAISGTAAIKWAGVVAQPWETELAIHATANGCPYPSQEQVQQAWLAWATDLRTLLGDSTIPITTWKHRDESHLSDVYITPGVSFAWYHNSVLETLPVVVPRLTLVRAYGYKMSDDQPNLYLRTEDYVDLGVQFFRHLLFGQVSVNPGDGLEQVAVGITWGQSQKTGYIPAAQMASIDLDPDLWSLSTFPGANTVDQNALCWNPVTMQIEPLDLAINGGNGSWGTTAGTCGPEVPVNARMKRRFSEDPLQSTRFVSFKFTVPGSSCSPEVTNSTGCWDPSLTTRPATTASCSVSVLTSPARGRFTAAAGTFVGPQWVNGSSVTVAGSGLGAQGIGGNNSGQWTVQQVYAVAGDGSWVEILGTFVTESTRTFTITVGPPPIWPEFLRQWAAFQRDCQRLGIIPIPVYIDGEQGESDLDHVELYEASFKRVWDALVDTVGKRVRGAPPIAKCITLLHKKTPFLPLYGTGSVEEQAAAADAQIEAMRTIQKRVADGMENSTTVDPSGLPLQINQFGSWPRTSRAYNGVHHTSWAMIQKGFLVDAALATLDGIPPHPQGELAVAFGAVDGGTPSTSGTDDAGTDDAGAGTDAVVPSEPSGDPTIASNSADIIAAIDTAMLQGADVASYVVNGRQVTLRSMTEMLEARRYFEALRSRSQGLRRTRVRFGQ